MTIVSLLHYAGVSLFPFPKEVQCSVFNVQKERNKWNKWDMANKYSNRHIKVRKYMEIPEFVNALITSDDINKLKVVNPKDLTYRIMINLLNGIPWVGGVIASEATTALDTVSMYREGKFLRKLFSVVYGIQGLTKDDMTSFMAEVEAKSQDFSGNVMADMIDKIDNINKGTIIGNLIKGRVEGKISIEDFFRLTSMLERIPYVDLKLLLNYQQPHYSIDGDTEMLYATGALKLHTIDAGSNDRYILSTLGVKLMTAGLGLTVDVDNSGGIDIPGMITADNIEENDTIQDLTGWYNSDN